MPIDVVVPALGESVSEAIITKWNFAHGDYVQRDDVLVELETDKVSVEVSAPEAGILQIIAAQDANVAVGDCLCRIDETAKESEKIPAKSARPTAGKPQTTTNNNTTPIIVPALGESVSEAMIAKWNVTDGDAVNRDDVLVELETDKVSVEVSAPHSGILKISAQPGSIIAVGAVLGQICETDGSACSPPKATPLRTITTATANAANIKAGPAVRQLMRERGIAASNVSASGLHGNITQNDLLQTKPITPPKPIIPPKPVEPPITPFTPAANLNERNQDPRGEERIRMSKLRQNIAIRLKQAQNNAAILTTFNEINMTALINLRKEYKEAFLKKYNIRLGFMSFFAKASVVALKEIPTMNAEIYGDEIIYKNYYDIGIAVGSANGLVVPILRDVDQCSFSNIETGIHDFGVRARAGKIQIDDMRGGTFTITNGGIFGSLLSTPIINPPQSAILGMHKIQKRPVVIENAIQIADMMYLALSYDHRIVDGREAVTFLVRIKELIESPARLLLDV